LIFDEYTKYLKLNFVCLSEHHELLFFVSLLVFFTIFRKIQKIHFQFTIRHLTCHQCVCKFLLKLFLLLFMFYKFHWCQQLILVNHFTVTQIATFDLCGPYMNRFSDVDIS